MGDEGEALVAELTPGPVLPPLPSPPPDPPPAPHDPHASAPPGLKPKKGEGDAPAEPPRPGESAPRFWMPGSSDALPAPPAAAAAAAKSEGGKTELQKSLEAFARFDDEIQIIENPEPSAPPPPARHTFTELELEGDSLLHAVEAAAAVGLSQRGQAQAAPVEESMDISIEESRPESAGALPKIPLFSDLPPDAFIALFERCPLKRFAPGETVFQQGSLGESFFVICGGAVKVFRTDGEARRDIATLDEGAFFGEMALLSGAPRTASVEAAAEDTQLLEISAPVLTELSVKYPPVAKALKKFCRQRLLTNVMNSSALFAPFPKADRRRLVERFRAREVKKGDVLIKQGERSDGMYVVLSGEVHVHVGPSSVASLKEGDIFGEMSLLTKAPAAATCAAARRTSLLRLPREDFDQIMVSHPQILNLVSELTDERRKQNAALASRAPKDGAEPTPMV
jgi:CRP-like cAMP-binding protein